MKIIFKILDNILNRGALWGAQIGVNVRLYGRIKAENPNNINIGDGSWIDGLIVVGPGKVVISKKCIIRDLFIETNTESALIFIGEGVYIGRHVHFICASRISIGQNALIAPKVILVDNDHEVISGALYKNTNLQSEPIDVGSNVWLAANVTVLKGVSIAENTIVGANSLVLKDISANKICAGNPLRVIRDVI